MLKRLALTSIGLVFLAAPLFASADSTCPTLSRTLARGSRGNDVVQLQQFLIAQGSLQSGLATGYFGVLTEASVKSWQSQNGVDSIGIVGPKTRAAIARACGTDPIDFQASRQSGTVPTSLQFSWKLGSNKQSYYGVDFGDGTSCSGYDCVFGYVVHFSADYTPESLEFQLRGRGQASHQYTSPGTYTARLIGTGNATLASQTTIFFAGQQGQPAVGMWVSPTSGHVPLVTSIGWQGYGRESVENYSVDYGDGSHSTNATMKCRVASAAAHTIFSYILQLMIPVASANTAVAPNCSANHTYTTPGTYTVRLLSPDGSLAGSVVVTAK